MTWYTGGNGTLVLQQTSYIILYYLQTQVIYHAGTATRIHFFHTILLIFYS